MATETAIETATETATETFVIMQLARKNSQTTTEIISQDEADVADGAEEAGRRESVAWS